MSSPPKKTRHLLVASYMSIIVMVVAFGMISFNRIEQLSALNISMHRHQAAVADAATKINQGINTMRQHMTTATRATPREELDVSLEIIEKTELAVYVNFAVLKKRYHENEQLIVDIRQKFSEWRNIRDEIVLHLRNDRREQAAKIESNRGADHVFNITNQMDGVIAAAADHMQESMVTFKRVGDEAKSIIFWVSLGILVTIGGTAAFVLVRVAQSKRELLQSEVRLRAATETAKDAIITTDKFGKLVEWNPGAEKVFGYSKDEIIGAPITKILPLDSKNAQSASLKMAIESANLNSDATVFDIAALTKDNTVISVELSLSKWKTADQIFFTGIMRDTTLRKIAENKMRILSRAIEQSSSAIIITDQTGTMEYVNPAFSNITGYSPEEVIGENPRILQSGNTAPQVYENLWKTILSGNVWHGALHNRKKNGDLFWEVASIAPVKNKAGETTNFVAIKDDITKVKEISKKLRESAQRFSGIFHANPVALAVVGIDDGLINDVNARWCTLFSYKREEVLEKTIFELGMWNSHDDRNDFLAKVKQNLHARNFETTFVTNDGTPLAILISGEIVPGIDTPQMLIAFDDITWRKSVENSLRKSEERFRLVTDNLPAFIAYVDREQRYQFNNKMYQKRFGKPVTELAGKKVREVTGERMYDQFSEHIDSVLKGKTVEFDCLGPEANGPDRDLHGTFIPHIGEDDEILGYFSLIFDVTEQKQAQRESEKLENDLQQASKLEAVGQLAGGIAHEINTPAQYIGDNLHFMADSHAAIVVVLDAYQKVLELAKAAGVAEAEIKAAEAAIEDADIDYLKEEISEAIEQAIGGTKQVGRIVMAMKEFSHPSSKKKIQIDINRAIQTAITVCSNEWKYNSNLETELAPDMPPVMCLPGEINQVLLNLIVNAAHAVTARGETSKGQIAISSHHQDDWAEIRVSDTGTGIPEDTRARVFEPFFTTKEVGKGTGQGLAICRDIIVNKHNGTLTFDTEMGKGTTFTIRIPISGETPSQGAGV